MREKYESLPLVQLKELAKVRGLKGTSTMKKAELVEAMLAEDERLKKEEEAKAAEQKQESATETVRSEEPQKQERSERPVRQERNYRQDRYDRQDRNDRNYRTDRTERTDRAERTDRSETGTEMVGVRSEAYTRERTFNPNNVAYDESQYPKELDSGIEASGILEVMPDGYGFIRCENYMPGENDVYVAPSQIRRFGLKTGDILKGNKRIKTQQEKFSALLFVKSINGYTVEESAKRMAFEDMTPIFPDERIKMETPGCSVAMRVMDLVSPVGKGQRGMIVSPPKAGKTTLLKSILGLIPPLSGEVEQGDYLEIGYFEQEMSGSGDNSCIEEIWQEFPAFTQYEVRSALARCGLTTKHIESRVKVLSGGEQAKVRLCKLMNRATNVLLLDEPTNHLDVDAKDELKRALKEYKGSILMVCHEPEFYDGLATQVWDLSQWTTKL